MGAFSIWHLIITGSWIIIPAIIVVIILAVTNRKNRR